MVKQDYYNTIGLQVESLFELVSIQTGICFNTEKLENIMPREDFAKIRRIVLTGCGDSYSAAGAMGAVVQKLSGAQCSSPDPMEFTRFYTKEDVLAGCATDEVLVVAISASGSAERIVEILEKANAMGVKSMLISNNPASKGAAAAQKMFFVATPELCNSPGLRSYFASMISLVALGGFIGLCRGTLPENEFLALKPVIDSYILAYKSQYETIDAQMFSLAQSWKNFDKFEVVGDWGQLFSAQFIEEKFIECAGVQCSHADSEDWCHINFFLRNPKNIGTIFVLNNKEANFDRIKESTRVAVCIGRPVLIVSNAAANEFDDRAVVCQVPSPQPGFEWLAPLMDFAPACMLAAYRAAVTDTMFFGGRYDFRQRCFLPEEAHI